MEPEQQKIQVNVNLSLENPQSCTIDIFLKDQYIIVQNLKQIILKKLFVHSKNINPPNIEDLVSEFYINEKEYKQLDVILVSTIKSITLLTKVLPNNTLRTNFETMDNYDFLQQNLQTMLQKMQDIDNKIALMNKQMESVKSTLTNHLQKAINDLNTMEKIQ